MLCLATLLQAAGAETSCSCGQVQREGSGRAVACLLPQRTEESGEEDGDGLSSAVSSLASGWDSPSPNGNKAKRVWRGGRGRKGGITSRVSLTQRREVGQAFAH